MQKDIKRYTHQQGQKANRPSHQPRNPWLFEGKIGLDTDIRYKRDVRQIMSDEC